MIVLAIDTSGRAGSVALARGDAQDFEVLESRTLAGGMFSAELVPKIAEMLGARQLQKKDIDLLAVCSGPGSFTGLRIGISTAKALAVALQKPLTAATVLEAIAFNAAADPGLSPSNRLVVSALDAQRGDVFSGEYELATAIPNRLCEALSSFNDFSVWLSARSPMPEVRTPDAVLLQKLRSTGTAVVECSRPDADAYARIGLLKFFSGLTVAPDDFDADYIRRSDAELFNIPK
jgi:tRNA threonylcarbamoyladenosine biosynthesis protein TsaB